MAEKYSELEVAPNEQREPLPEAVDQAAHAPERDLSSDAPELDNKAWPLSVTRTAHISLWSIEFTNVSVSRVPHLLPTLLPTPPLDLTSSTKSVTLRRSMASQIPHTIQIRIRKR